MLLGELSPQILQHQRLFSVDKTECEEYREQVCKAQLCQAYSMLH